MEPKEGQGEKPKRKVSQYNKIQRDAIKKTASETFKKFKGMTVVQYLIMSGKIVGKTDEELAKQLDCHESTIRRHKEKLKSQEWYQDIGANLLDLAPIGIEALKVSLLQANPFTIAQYFKGLGFYTDKREIHHKADPEKIKQDFIKRAKGTLGLGIKKQLKEAGIDPERETPDADRPDQESPE